MKTILAVVGKTTNGTLRGPIEDYASRLAHYLPFSITYIDDIKNTKSITEEQQKHNEGKNILARIDKSDFVVLLDEHGKEYTSVQFSKYMEKRLATGAKRLIFVVGGPYGFSEEVYNRANDKLSLSKMTFPHELIRLIFTEQLYRAMTILKGEPYHHE